MEFEPKIIEENLSDGSIVYNVSFGSLLLCCSDEETAIRVTQKLSSLLSDFEQDLGVLEILENIFCPKGSLIRAEVSSVSDKLET